MIDLAVKISLSRKWGLSTLLFFCLINFSCGQDSIQSKKENKVERKSTNSINTMDWDKIKLYIRKNGDLIEAPENDIKVAKNYPDWVDKGNEINGKRLTIMTEKSDYRLNEEVRVIHVVDYVSPGQDAFLMGPKKVYNEYINGELVTEGLKRRGKDPLIPEFYDGLVMKSPVIDFNFDITAYRLSEKGIYNIQWILGPYRSNVVKIIVGEE